MCNPKYDKKPRWLLYITLKFTTLLLQELGNDCQCLAGFFAFVYNHNYTAEMFQMMFNYFVKMY